MSAPTAPDTGECLRLWLRSVGAVTALVGTRVALTLTGSSPAIRLHNLFDLPAGDASGAVASRWSVECWGAGSGAADDGTSGDIARAVGAATPDFTGTWDGSRVAGAAVERTYRQDDPTTGRPRHIVELAFIAHP